MTKHLLGLPSLLAVTLVAACGQASDEDRLSNEAESHPARHDPVNAPSPYRPGDPAPVAAPGDQRSPQAAAAVARRYFALVEAGDYVAAHRLWSGDDLSDGAFAASFDRYRTYHGEVGEPGRIEGAAGSLYVRIPVTVTGTLQNGEPFRLQGPVTLRRANQVPGATPEQLQWRIYRTDLDPRPQPQPAAYRFVGRWASDQRNCASRAWQFTTDRLTTPAGSVCTFRSVREVPGGYDIAATCTAESPPTDDTLELRFAESARALLFESDVIADAGLMRCP